MKCLTNTKSIHQVICLMAPTASGKTALAYQLYETGRYELISVDSALVYRDMNIGTAKPSEDELRQYPHHLVSIIDPTQRYSVADFVNDVERLIDEIHGRGKIPLLIGGTMMYYMALFEGLSNVPNSDPVVRAQVECWRQQEGIGALYDYLQQVDAVLWARLKPNDTQRITRAVEVYKQTGKPLSYWQSNPKLALANNSNQRWYGLVVMPDRAWLHQRIEQRLAVMWQQGFIDEVIRLINQYSLTVDMPSMRCVGYRQVIQYLLSFNDTVTLVEGKLYSAAINYKQFKQMANTNKNQLAYQELQNKALYATRQLAKRQYTWLRKLGNMQTLLHPSINPVINQTFNNQTMINTNTIDKNRSYSMISFDSMNAVTHFLNSDMNVKPML